MKEKVVKVRLSRAHYLNGKRRQKGSIIKLGAAAAQWLIDKRRAKAV